MVKKLVIVESPAKVKTIKKILGRGYDVKSSVGHIRDLPQKKFGVDIKKGFEPKYVVVKGREKIVKELSQDASAAEAVYLAPDPDREGEAIAWHLKCLLEKDAGQVPFYRVSYNEVTPRGVSDAFEHPRDIDMNRVHAQQARRIVDRIVGYKVSPLLWSRVRSGLSAGRVQSVALRLLCEREEEINRFVPEEYWALGVEVRKLVDPRDSFPMRLLRVNGEKADISTGSAAQAVLSDLEGRQLRIVSLASRDTVRRPYPPFITSTLQQAASGVFRFAPARTMRIAQKLYEGIDIAGETVGLITYMRTDSFSISQDALSECRELIRNEYGAEYLPAKPNFYKSRPSAQEAHEAIRPTSVLRHPDEMAKHLDPSEIKLYRLIWQRFVASQMTPARIRHHSAEAEAVPPPGRDSTYLFRASASEMLFPGFTRLTGMPEEKKGKKEVDYHVERLPPLVEGEEVAPVNWLSEKKETQPPRRYTQASLIRELDRNGVGRPSTYAQIVTTLGNRRYVADEKRALVPTPLGLQVNGFLVQNLSELFDVKFTATMEEHLDEIEKGVIGWRSMIGNFYDSFKVWLTKAKGPPADEQKVQWLLAELEAVTEWQPPVKYGKRTYSDEKFVQSIHTQADTKVKPISQRQLQALARLACRYEKQLPGIAARARERGLGEAADAVRAPAEATLRKLDLLCNVKYDEPVERGGRTYDDREYVESITSQAKSGRGLSPAQVRRLDRLLFKYSDQIGDFEFFKSELGLDRTDGDDAESAAMIETMSHIKEWRPPVKHGKREFNDKAFYESLCSQFATRGALSPRQKAALKKMMSRYKEQLPLDGTAPGPGDGSDASSGD